ncbi:hypothetical protein DFS34DRAFT_632465 [Phlyctochytrium arcticum]|nr:hypothetical protein DFS34DRAFT_632465 [Phlyctochytrium arcticum]
MPLFEPPPRISSLPEGEGPPPELPPRSDTVVSHVDLDAHQGGYGYGGPDLPARAEDQNERPSTPPEKDSSLPQIHAPRLALGDSVPTDNSGPVESATLRPPSKKYDANHVSHPAYTGPRYDVTFRFLGATDLPKMDLIGTADPYFRANVDESISYCSTCIYNTLTPTWNELWVVRNIPADAKLNLTVYDKDVHLPADELVGMVTIPIVGSAVSQALNLQTILHKSRGTFYLTLEVTEHKRAGTDCQPYSFGGPLRYTIHYSPLVGQLTRLNDARLYATWKIHLSQIEDFLPSDRKQHWNTKYKAAQNIFQGPMSWSVRGSIQTAHRMLYARSWGNGGGILVNGTDMLNLLMWSAASNPNASTSPAPQGQSQQTPPSPPCTDSAASQPPSLPARQSTQSLSSAVTQQHPPIPKPCMYTYIIDDQTWRFSETGAAFLVDFASKHALHSNCSEYVRYAGEFHIRPTVGWDKLAPAHSQPVSSPSSGLISAAATESALQQQLDLISDYTTLEWELWIDNNSGTYAPDKTLLPDLASLLQANFPGLNVRALDREDPDLAVSRTAMKAFAEKSTVPTSLFPTSLFSPLASTPASSLTPADTTVVASREPTVVPTDDGPLRASGTRASARQFLSRQFEKLSTN